MRPAIACLFALAISACSSTTGVLVRVDAQSGAVASAERVRVRVLSADGVIRLDETRALASVVWPLRVPIVPEGDDASRAWIVEATLLSATGAELSYARARGAFESGEVRDAALCLFAGCSGQPCSACDGGACTTCVDGVCADAESPLFPTGAAPRCPRTEPADAGALDAGCTPSAEDTPASCTDGIDNDCDGRVDCAQPSCCIALACENQSCGGVGSRCCDFVCVNTLASEAHCGVCRNQCPAGRSCMRVPGMLPTDPSPGAACRCAVGTTECMGLGVCETHDSSALCNCVTDDQCGGHVCRRQGAMHHTYCDY